MTFYDDTKFAAIYYVACFVNKSKFKLYAIKHESFLGKKF